MHLSMPDPNKKYKVQNGIKILGKIKLCIFLKALLNLGYLKIHLIY